MNPILETGLSANRMLIAMFIGILVLVLMILKTKIHAFVALILSALFIGVLGGMPRADIIKSITDGFGSTLGNIGIIIGLGVMMGRLFEISGAATRMAYTFLKIFGKNREEEAMATTGFLVSIPIYCDSGFIILSPIAKALSRQTRKSVISMGIALAAGLVITHSLVPPTPGPVGAAGIFNANVGAVILWGIIIAIPMVITTLIYARYMGKQIYQLPGEGENDWIRPKKEAYINRPEQIDLKNLPSSVLSFMPIIVPVILILGATVTNAMGMKGLLFEAIQFLGTAFVAVTIGLLIAIFFLAKHLTREQAISEMEKGIQSAGIIILVTGGGGALGTILKNSGIGLYIAEWISQTSIPVLLLPFLIATIIRFIQGSGTVAMLTAASITAPIIVKLDVNPVFATLSACVGSLFFSYFNDSFYWVVNRTLGIKETKEQIRVWSVTTTIAWATGFICILILNAIFG